MYVRITLENETKDYWTFREEGIENSVYDISKSQLANAFKNLEYWQETPGGTNFSTKLYNLIAKADAENFRKLFKGFPARVTAYILWYQSVNKEELNRYRGGING